MVSRPTTAELVSTILLYRRIWNISGLSCKMCIQASSQPRGTAVGAPRVMSPPAQPVPSLSPDGGVLWERVRPDERVSAMGKQIYEHSLFRKVVLLSILLKLLVSLRMMLFPTFPSLMWIIPPSEKERTSEESTLCWQKKSPECRFCCKRIGRGNQEHLCCWPRL